MNFRTTSILFGIVLVFGLILLGLNLFTDDAAPSGALVEELADAGVKADQVDTVEVERTDAAGTTGTLKVVRQGKDKWQIEEPVKARADAAAVESVVNAMFKVRPTNYPELRDNLSVHGLAPAGLKVTLRGGGKASTVNVGEVTFGSKAVAFVTTSARPSRPMAVPASELSALLKDGGAKEGGPAGKFAKWASDYRVKAVFALDPRTGADDVTAIKLTSKGKELALSKPAGEWKFDAPAGWGDASLGGDTSAANPSAVNGVRGLLNTVVTLQAGGADDFITDPKDLKEYGLDPSSPELVRVEIKAKDGPPEVAYIGKKADGAPPVPGAPGKVYVRVEGTPGVLKVNAPPTLDGLAGIVADPTPLRDRDLLRDEVRNRVDGIDVVTGGQTVKLRKAGGEWKLFGGPNDPTTANGTAVSNLLGLLVQQRVVKDFPAPNDANFAGPELKAEVKLWADGVEPATDPKPDPKAEPKLKGAPTVFQFGKKDANGVYVRRILPTGAKADFILPERVKIGTEAADTEVLTAVTRDRLAFFEAPIKTFALTEANRLTIAVGPKVTEVAHDKTAAPNFPTGRWTFAQPADLKGVTADAELIRGDLLNFLASQRAERYFAENATDEQLNAWQLGAANSRLVVTVGLDVPTPPAPPPGAPAPPAPDKDRVYRFGADAPDGKSVYVRQGDDRVVFAVPKSLYEKFAAADLRDKVVVRFDPTKVKLIRIRGWKEATGELLTREFKREGGNWATTNPPGYAADPAKIDEFLKAVLALKVKEFRPGPEHPDHRFTPENGAFEVTIDPEGGEPLLLVIGAEVDNKASRIGKLTILPPPPRTNLFTLPPDALEAYRKNAAAFAK